MENNNTPQLRSHKSDNRSLYPKGYHVHGFVPYVDHTEVLYGSIFTASTGHRTEKSQYRAAVVLSGVSRGGGVLVTQRLLRK